MRQLGFLIPSCTCYFYDNIPFLGDIMKYPMKCISIAFISYYKIIFLLCVNLFLGAIMIALNVINTEGFLFWGG